MELEKIKEYLGSLLGGLVATIPWILMYVYGGYILSVLGFLIGYGAIYGYKLFGGKIEKNTFILTMISTILSITIATFVLIPLLLMWNEGFDASLDNLKVLYNTEEFITSIIGDYIISLFFAILGASSTKKIINKERPVEEQDIDTSSMTFEEKVELLRKYYEKYNAFDKENMISDFQIMKELNVLNKTQFLTEMERKGVTTGTIGKSYFNKDYLENPEKYKKIGKKNQTIGVVLGIVLSIIILPIIIIPAIIYTDKESEVDEPSNTIKEEVKFNDYTYKELKIKLPNTFIKLNETEDSKEKNYIVLSKTKENDTISVVLLQKIDISDIISFDDYVNYYKVEMNETKLLQKEETNILNNLNYYELRYQDNENKTMFHWTYLVNKNNYIYLISFTTEYNNFSTDSVEKQTKTFEDIDKVMDSYFSTIEILENNS